MMAKRIAKRRPVKLTTFHSVHHEDYVGKIEESFKSNGVQYFTFKSDLENRTGRYMVIQNFLQEVNMRMDRERLKLYAKRMREELDGTKGTINVGNAIMLVEQILTLTELAFEPDTVYRLASALHFDATEDLTTWDKGHNDKKIKGWKEAGTLDFFYRKPLKELIGLRDISETDLRGFLEKVQALNDAYSTSLSATPAQ